MTNLPVHDRVRDALSEAGADFNVIVRDSGETVRYGVLRIPSIPALHEALDERGLWASYSAGSGWSFYEREEGEM